MNERIASNSEFSEIDRVFSLFVQALRNVDIRVSPAETLDAFHALAHVGYEDKNLLRNSLALTLAKSQDEKDAFDAAFERFFSQLAFQKAPKGSVMRGFDKEIMLTELDAQLPSELMRTLKSVLGENRDQLTLAVQEAANKLRITEIESLREKRTYARSIAEILALPALDEVINNEQNSGFLRYIRQYLRQEIDEYVTKQYEIHVDPSSRKALIQAALKSHLNQVPKDYYEDLRSVIEKLADSLVKKKKRQRRDNTRGSIDVKRTLRSNMAYDGNLFDVRWRRTKREPNNIFVLCDVSSSVAAVARFLLLFLYELVDVLPQVRAFAFSSALGEVTDLFRSKVSEEAIEAALFDWGKGNTDYGRVLTQFQQQCGKELTKRSILILVGDGRSNYYDPCIDVLRQLSTRVQAVYWLNPEPRSQWQEGDSVMQRYAPFCTRVEICHRLGHIERFANQLVQHTR